ncbi:hypothetical protein EJ110_NYTH29881 [Nymphaea thermarum]|nr:hypothetical protein EJ110_NYTH29881 [Nymphaea thermarum]
MFAKNVLTVQGIVKQRNLLRQMFSSDEWAAYPQAYKRQATTIVNMNVLRLADSEQRPSIRYFCETMDRAKESMSNLKGNKKLYMPIWKIIDHKWFGQFHCSLHATAYYLNPFIIYHPTFKKDREVEYSILECIDVSLNIQNELLSIFLIYKYDTSFGIMARYTTI